MSPRKPWDVDKTLFSGFSDAETVSLTGSQPADDAPGSENQLRPIESSTLSFEVENRSAHPPEQGARFVRTSAYTLQVPVSTSG
jgi:hypothetical protein